MNTRRRNNSGFTLLEILVVIVITIMMIGLILGPVAQTFNLTSRAQKQIEAQDTARVVLEQISRELSEAVFVYDNTDKPIIVQIFDSDGNAQDVNVYYAMIDFVPPRMVCHCMNPNHPEGESREFPRDIGGMEEASPICPVSTCNSSEVEIRPAQPLQPNTNVVRYFIAKKFPEQPWNSPFATGTVAGGEDNPYVLYRAEYNPWDEGLRKDEPDFFYNPDSGPLWWKISRIVGPAKDVDMIESGIAADKTTIFARPFITFTPTAVQNDPLTPTYMSDIDAEVPKAIPTVFRASFGHWTPNIMVKVFRNGFTTPYYTAYSGNRLCVFDSDGNEVFDITQFQSTGAFSPAGKLDLMFDVDPKNGDVSFAMPGEIEEFDSDNINDAFYNTFKIICVGERKIQVNPYIPNAKIVPGSEEIIERDATPGPNHINPVRYERVPFAISDPGRNQYKINYGNGEICFSPRFDEPLPPGKKIEVRYKFHNNLPGDIVRADYTTKNLITISMQIRMYDPASGKSQSMQLANKVKVNNTVR